MEPEVTSHTEFDLVVHEPVEPTADDSADDSVHYQPVEDPNYKTPRPQITATDLAGIYLMIKSVRRGVWGQGDERAENLLAFGFDSDSVTAVVHEADQVK